ncbi:uncharacterized protein EAF02_000769 [Botrytis sinoallii]|uniref:uncharacterized protein n=1 Tax=Botrytis sinoallii TaxID=1463999 RepID=UPI0019010346|nr:uncharacterized protein EAF02_000769 [Botrytis sinoallii]KAF7893231.1 hypothetical protein EAF02_000769 [Botrytis sinoallii]
MSWHKPKGRVYFMLIEAQIIIIIISLLLVEYPMLLEKHYGKKVDNIDLTRTLKCASTFLQTTCNRQKSLSSGLDEVRYIESNLAAGIFTLCFFLTRQLLALTTSTSTQTKVYLLSCVFSFWVMSCISQRSPDHSDPSHPSRLQFCINAKPSCVLWRASFHYNTWASQLFSSHSASQFCDEVERERSFSDGENLLMRAWGDF